MTGTIRTPLRSLVHVGRGLYAASWLGWQISSNWTRPLAFFIYTVLRPVSGALILVVMYRFISGNSPRVAAYLAFLVTGVAFWSFVQSVLAGLANAISEDRGYYHVLKYVYTAPQHIYIYLFGRGAAQMGVGLLSTLIVLALAIPVLGLPIDPLRVNYPLLVLSCALALVAVLGFAMAYSMSLLAAHDAQGYGEVAAQVLYIVSGAIFPIGVLPGALAAIAAFSPLVYWMELVRRSLLGGHAILMFPGLSDQVVLLRLGIATAGAVALAHLAFLWADRRARRQGLIDKQMTW